MSGIGSVFHGVSSLASNVSDAVGKATDAWGGLRGTWDKASGAGDSSYVTGGGGGYDALGESVDTVRDLSPVVGQTADFEKNITDLQRLTKQSNQLRDLKLDMIQANLSAADHIRITQ